jgi:NADH-quinone oxidoreductase subunit F
MDIVLHNEAPTKGERDAVDAVLGPPSSGWDGATDSRPEDHHFARGGHAARAKRHLLLPTLHAVRLGPRARSP